MGFIRIDNPDVATDLGLAGKNVLADSGYSGYRYFITVFLGIYRYDGGFKPFLVERGEGLSRVRSILVGHGDIEGLQEGDTIGILSGPDSILFCNSSPITCDEDTGSLQAYFGDSGRCFSVEELKRLPDGMLVLMATSPRRRGGSTNI